MDTNSIQPYIRYEEANPLPDLSDILLSNESFCSVDPPHKPSSSAAQEDATASGAVCQVVGSSDMELYTALLNTNQIESRFSDFGNGVSYTSLLNTSTQPVINETRPAVIPQTGFNFQETADSIAEEEFLYQLNLSKCDKFTTTPTKNKPNTRNLAKLKCAKLNGVKTNPNKVSEKGPKSKYVTLKERISRLKAANQRQHGLKTGPKTVKGRNKPKTTATSISKSPVMKIKDMKKDDDKIDTVSGICRACHWAYSSKEERMKHFSDPNHIIKVEAKKSTDMQALKEEAKQFDNLQTPTKCKICGEVFKKRREFLVHHRKHTGLHPYKCVRCSMNFFRRCDLLGHLRNHLGLSLTYLCTECTAAFSKEKALTSHLIAKHGHIDNRPRNYKCTECNSAFMTKHAVNHHMRTHTGYSAVTCVICGKGFSSNFALVSHQRVHSGDMPFKCDQCQYVSKTKQLLIRHQRSHSGHKPFKCDICAYVSTNTSGLKRHMLKHTGSKPFKCPYCMYRSSNIENMRKHIKKTKKHLGMNIYPCQQCSFSSDDGSDFIRHVKQQHFPYLDEDSASATKLSGILVSDIASNHSTPLMVTSSAESPNVQDSGSTLPAVQSDGTADDAPTIEMLIVSNDLFNVASTQSQASEDALSSATMNDLDDLSSPMIRGLDELPPVSISALDGLSTVNNLDEMQASIDGLEDIPPASVNGLDEILLNALMKIPNLRKVILPQGDGNAPVTLVIGSDRNSPDDVMEDDDQPPMPDNETKTTNVVFEQPPSSSFSGSSATSGHQRYIISSSGIRSYPKE